jgi:hypothetical protein
MDNLNWEIILTNIQEAREELQELESKINSSQKPSELDFQLSLRHVYHHINFAWNIRHKKSEEYAKLTDSEFKEWGRFPNGLDSLDF